MDKSYKQLQIELDNLKKIVFRIMDFHFPSLDANFKHYNFITDEIVRRQLELDYLKMTQTPASNFNTYCQYSFFQIENLLNYYYILRLMDKLEPEITEFFAYDEKSKKYSSISEVPYNSKWIKFANEFLQTGNIGDIKRKTINYDIQKIAYVRNSSIHRNTKDTKKYEDELYKKYLVLKSKEEKSSEEWDIYNKGNRIEFKKNESFSVVRRRTAEFLKIIEPEIKKYQKVE